MNKSRIIISNFKTLISLSKMKIINKNLRIFEKNKKDIKNLSNHIILM